MQTAHLAQLLQPKSSYRNGNTESLTLTVYLNQHENLIS